MSKKIIYLLSLLMALSLMFASCKKNAAGTGDLTKPPVDNETGKEDANQDTGLFEEWSKIPKDTFIKEYEIFQNDGTDFYRNPVLVSMGDGRVFLFAELRYRRTGAANDVGIDGEGAVDIVYRVSENSGYDWDSQTYYVVRNSQEIKDAHGAPNVFLLGNDKIAVVASAGSGIGRTGTLADNKEASRVDYTIGTINGKTISWTDWKSVELNGGSKILDKIKTVKAIKNGSSSEVFNQYATVPGRGFVENNTVLLSLVIANQGRTNAGEVRELMGRYVLKGTVSGDAINWEQFEEPQVYTTSQMDLGPWKETQLYGGTSSEPKFFVVPSPWTANKDLRLGKSDKTIDKTIVPPTAVEIPASEGSAGYVNLGGKWFGKTEYTIGSMHGGQNYSVFLHVEDTSKNLTMRVIDNSNNEFKVLGQGWRVNDVGKSSSVDMLPDGTIIYAAEQGGTEKNYGFFFYRYSQYFIADKTGNQ